MSESLESENNRLKAELEALKRSYACPGRDKCDWLVAARSDAAGYQATNLGLSMADIRQREEIAQLRKMLWIAHDCRPPILYGDDGEMQCHKCHVDFKRDSVDDMQTKWIALHMGVTMAGKKT